MSLNNVGAPLCHVCVPWLADLDRVCFGGACVHPSALGCVSVCVWYDLPLFPWECQGTARGRN